MEVPQVILPNTVLIPGADLVDLNVVGASNVGIEDEMGKIAQEGIEENLSEEIFSNYQHQEIIPGCQPHPGDIVEAGPLSSLSLPPPSYPLTDSLPQDVISSGRLSSLQLEGILYSCQRHQTILNSGQRAGFFIGDGAGVGKGRQIAGIILDNFARGRTKHVWFSISADLIVDARRDLIDIGCFVKVIKGCQELDRETRVLGLPSDFKEGVVFSTYCTLVSSVQRGSAIINSSKQSRLKQLIDWCGGEKFEGCLIFDECHKAKNFVPENEHASTKVSMAVMTIQRLLPKARVVYCSATGVCDVKNMAFMERLGLWGEGAPFSSFENFIDAIHRKGLGAAEMLAMEMKTAGMYISRGLSFKQAEFLTVEAALTKEQVKMYDLSAHMWNELRKGLQIALQRTGSVNSRLWLQFWSSHQRFFKQLCMGMKVPVIIREAKTALDSGHSVVIGLQTTGEASLESELGKCKGDLQRFVSLCREIFLRFVIQYFPVKIEGKDNVEPQDDNWCVKAKERLVEFGQKIDLPDSPLDEIIDKFGGPDQVAEMTGRRGRVVRTSVKELPRYELRGSGPDSVREISSLNVRERNSFMDGKKLIAIISDAASTGISLHADLRVGNQRRREHLTIELPWSADKAVQQLGRSHRSNQSSGPLYKLVTTNLGGERRFAAAVARRLQSLGALTKGDRRAATGADLTTFNFDTFYGRSALKLMYRYICIGELVPGIPFALVNQEVGSLEVFLSTLQDSLVLMGLVEVGLSDTSVVVRERDSGDVRRFLNRILGLTVKKQNLIFNYFTKCLDLTIENARKEGKYNEGLLDITASSIEIVGQPQVVFKDLAKGNSVTRHVVLSIDRGMSWASACEIYKDCTGRHDGFYVSKREHFGRKLFLLAMQKDSPKHHFKIIRPNTGVSSFVVEKGDLFNKYSPISSNDAEKGWTGQYEDTKDRSMHGASRRDGRFITVGSRFYRIHLLCGSILTLMSVLEEVVARNIVRFHLSKFETTIRVVRAQLNSGERIVGIRYPEVLIPEVEKILKEHQIIKRVQMMQNCQLTQSPIRQPATVTTVSPVIPKCLSKALTPPVTIKSFFKAAGTSSANETNHQHSDRLPDLLLSNSSTSDKAGGCFRAVGTASQRNSKADFQSSGKPACRKRSQNYTQSGKGMFVKRPKQSTILASFTNLAVKEEKQETPLVLSNCPVCGEQFSSRLSNVEINAHIDSCLIE